MSPNMLPPTRDDCEARPEASINPSNGPHLWRLETEPRLTRPSQPQTDNNNYNYNYNKTMKAQEFDEDGGQERSIKTMMMLGATRRAMNDRLIDLRANSFKRPTGDSRWFSDRRSGNIFLKSRASSTNEQQLNEPTSKAIVEQERVVCSAATTRAANDKPLPVKHSLPNNNNNNNNSHTCHHRRSQQPITTTTTKTTTVLGCLRQRSAISWMRQAPVSKFISLSATSVCLLSSSTKLLLQLMLIMMLIMIPLSVIKCPSAVVVVSASQQQARPALLVSLPLMRPLNEEAATMARHRMPKRSGQKVSSNEQQEIRAWRSEGPKARPDMDLLEATASGGVSRTKRALFEQHPGYHKLSLLWNFLRASYPSLATHMYSLATTKTDDRLLAHTIKLVGRLLDEVEKLVHDHLVARGQATMPKVNLTRNTSAWLSKMAANPMYNRIIQKYQNHVLPDRHNINNNKIATTKSSSDNQDNDSTSSLAHYSSLSHQPREHTQTTTPVYGQVIHYPHEATNKVASTLDKLKLLNPKHLNQLHNNEIDPTNELEQSGTSDEQIQSNQIPSITRGDGGGGDGEPWPSMVSQQQQEVRSETDNVDSARRKYVYGEVAFRPSQMHHNQRHRPLKVLKEDLERASRTQDEPPQSDAMGLDDESRSSILHPATPPHQRQMHSKNKEPTSESYGRVLVSPPKLSDRTTSETQVDGGEQVDRSSGWKINDKHEEILNKARHFPEFASNDDGAGSQRGLDELATQQLGGSMAANEPESEFEGVWYSGPIQQVEVRQLRSDNTKSTNGHKLGVALGTTSNPKDALLVD